jgi:hypothetical protein
MMYFSEGQGEFESDLVVIVDKNEFEAVPEALTVEEALQQTVEGGKIGNLRVDRESLSLDGVGKF